MPILHDSETRAAITQRLVALRPDSERRWGAMSVEQMLWHVNQAMAAALGEVAVAPRKLPLPRPVLKFIVLNLPWMKGAPTHPGFLAKGAYDFDAERARCLRLIDTFTARSIDSEWPLQPNFGRMSGRHISRLQAKHLNHHLSQFGL
jgi:hypothetical protein